MVGGRRAGVPKAATVTTCAALSPRDRAAAASRAAWSPAIESRTSKAERAMRCKNVVTGNRRDAGAVIARANCRYRDLTAASRAGGELRRRGRAVVLPLLAAEHGAGSANKGSASRRARNMLRVRMPDSRCPSGRSCGCRGGDRLARDKSDLRALRDANS